MDPNEVEREGFHPLRKSPTEPKIIATKNDARSHLVSVNQETGATEKEQTIWEGSSWSKLQKSRGKLMDRANSFVGEGGGTRSRSGTVDLSHQAIVIVDPFSTGIHLAKEVVNAGYKCARVFSIWDSPVAALVQKGIDVDFCATIQHNDTSGAIDAAINEVRVFISQSTGIHGRAHHIFLPPKIPHSDCGFPAFSAFRNYCRDPWGRDWS